MTKATSISLSKFTSSLQSAIAAAQQRNPKIALDPVKGITVSSVVLGGEIPWPLAATLTVAEMQAFADDVAGTIGGLHPELVTAADRLNARGTVMSVGGHVIVGMWPVEDVLELHT